MAWPPPAPVGRPGREAGTRRDGPFYGQGGGRASAPTSPLIGSKAGVYPSPSSTVTLWVSEAVAPPLSVTVTPIVTVS